MALVDVLNRSGRSQRLKPLGRLVLGSLLVFGMPRLLRIAGRRLVTASAAGPAILQTSGDIGRALKNADLLREAMEYTVDAMKLDTFCLPPDLSLEAEILGCDVSFVTRDFPSVASHPVADLTEAQRLKPVDPYKNGRMPVFLETLRGIRKRYALLVAAPVTGPFTLAMQLRGPAIYVDTIKNASLLQPLLEFCEQTASRYAGALVKSGADIIMIAEPGMSQMSAASFVRFSLPYCRRIAESLNRPCLLHICGKVDHLIDSMCQPPLAGISIDDVDMARVVKRVPARSVIVGNISPLFLLYRSPDEIRAKTAELVALVGPRRECIIAPGCDLAPETPLANVLAFQETVKALS